MNQILKKLTFAETAVEKKRDILADSTIVDQSHVG